MSPAEAERTLPCALRASRTTTQTHFYDLKFTCYQGFCYSRGNWPRTSFCIICVELIVRLQYLIIRRLSVRFLVLRNAVFPLLSFSAILLDYICNLDTRPAQELTVSGGFWLPCWPSSVSVAVIKYPKNSREEGDFDSNPEGHFRSASAAKVWPQVEGRRGGQEAHSCLSSQEAERTGSGAHPLTVLPPVRLHLLKVSQPSQTASPVRDQVCKHKNLWRTPHIHTEPMEIRINLPAPD